MQPNSSTRTFPAQPPPGPNSRPNPAKPGHLPCTDTGYPLSASCLICWRPQCVHDMTPREVLDLRHRSLGLDTAARCQKLLDHGLAFTEAVDLLAAQVHNLDSEVVHGD